MKLIILLVAIATISWSDARVTTNQQPITPHITSLTDKDARYKASVHPAFANAGRQAGVEIWRIQNFDPVAVSQKDFGKFYKGDSYIVLKTTSDKRNNLSWDIYYWIGSESTQDESGAAAILTVGLDDKFDGKAVQHRETLGHESSQFLSFFQPSIRYLDGGHASGFKHVTTNPGAEKRMFQVKGKKNIRVRQVDPLISSMNKGDCFILDVNQDILVFVGDKAKNVEKLKAISMANQIRDQDHNGRGRVEIIDQYSSEVDIQRFFTALGSGSKDIVPEESAGGDDQAFEKSEEQSATLSEVSDKSGSLKVTALTKPYKQEQLKNEEVYILDTVSGSVYVWVGKKASQREKTEAMAKAQELLSSKNYPSWVKVQRIPQGTEPAIFKQYFTTWRDVGMSHSRIVRSAVDVVAASFDNAFTVYNGLYEIQMNKPVKIVDFTQHDLREDMTYILHTKDTTYIWIGENASDIQKKKAYLTVDILKQVMVHRHIIAVKQGQEPEGFIEPFGKWDPNMWPKQTEHEIDIESILRNEIDV